MSRSPGAALRSERGPRYLIVALAVLVLLVVALGLFHTTRASAGARDKADQLSAAFTAAGLPAPNEDQVVQTLANDGGSVCADPVEALHRSLENGTMTNGAGGPGQRPVIAVRSSVKAESLILSVYCPDQLPAFQQYVTPLRQADLTGEAHDGT